MSDHGFNELLDHCSLIGARRIADRICRHWRTRGYAGIQAWAEHSGLPVIPDADGRCGKVDLRSPHYVVRSNLRPDGFPPSLAA